MGTYVDPNSEFKAVVTADSETIAFQFKNNNVAVFTIYGDGSVSASINGNFSEVIIGGIYKICLDGDRLIVKHKEGEDWIERGELVSL